MTEPPAIPTAVRAGACLHHLHLSSPDPARLAAFYADVMDMTAAPQPDRSWLCTGPGRRLLFGAGAPKALERAAFACRDAVGLHDLRERRGLLRA